MKPLFSQAVKYLPENFLVKVFPELEVLVDVIFHYLTLFNEKSSVGQTLLGLRVKDTTASWKILLWIIFETCPKYLMNKFDYQFHRK